MADLMPATGVDLAPLGGDSHRAFLAIRTALFALDTRTADTGWQTITIPTGTGSELTGSGTARIRRVGSTVYLRLEAVATTSSAPTNGYLTPSGFIPVGYRAWYLERGFQTIGTTNSSNGEQVGIWHASRLRSGRVPVASKLLQGTISWITDDPFPTI